MTTEFRNNSRVAKVYKAGNWIDTPFQDIKKFDVFKLFEATGEAITDKFDDKGTEISTTLSVALGDAYLAPDDTMSVHCTPIPEV